jgi:CRISPR-associated endonuclease/helicase Cas3
MARIAGGYRHEFGSMREFADAYEGKISAEVFDLAMHMIAAHHGRGRPHFPKGGFDPDAKTKSDDIAFETVRRFARLQRRYGYWQLAWLENLLRCADAKASAGKDGHA